MSEFEAAESPRSLVRPQLVSVFEIWTEIAAGRVAPTREEIDPRKLRGLLPWTWMADVIDEGRDIRFRVAGERIVEFVGRRYTGEHLSAHEHRPFFARVKRLFSHCIATRKPVVLGPTRSIMEGREYLQLEILALPLSQDGESITGLFGAMEVWPAAAVP